MCPICAGQTIDQSKAALSDQMQALVREQLHEGWTDEQIRRYFVERYGERVLAAPPQRGFHLVAWLVPPLGLLVGFALLGLVLRAMRRRQAPAPGPTPPESPAGLEPYLAQVDWELRVASATPHARRQGEGVAEGGQDGTGERGGP
jgi:cytochrome c-type biogenesis protein CcmH/NrfF